MNPLAQRQHEILIAIGDILEVVVLETRGVFLRVALREYLNEDGTALETLCRLTTGYLGAAHGSWHIPDTDIGAVCFFPGLGPHGIPGGDLDEGYVIGFVSSLEEPPVTTGIGGSLSATRRIYKGKNGVAHDVHLQGDIDAKVEGAENMESVGAVTRIFRAAAQWLGDALVRIEAAADLLLHGADSVEITSDTLIRLTAPQIELVGNTVIEDRDFMDHTHGGVEPGSGNTSGVN